MAFGDVDDFVCAGKLERTGNCKDRLWGGWHQMGAIELQSNGGL